MNSCTIKRSEAILLPEQSHALMNNNYYLDYVDTDFTSRILLTKRNDKQYKELFGKCTFATNDWEFYTRCWVVEHNNETYLLFSSEKGSSIEIVIDSSWFDFAKNEEIGVKIVEFVGYLTEKVRELDSNKECIAQLAEIIEKNVIKA